MKRNMQGSGSIFVLWPVIERVRSLICPFETGVTVCPAIQNKQRNDMLCNKVIGYKNLEQLVWFALC